MNSDEATKETINSLSHTPQCSTLTAWLQLIRLPNILTVPGDPLAGYLLAGWALDSFSLKSVLPCVVASVLLYIAGLISNDYFDLAEDRKDRPNRPLPSGKIKPLTAIVTACILAVLGVAAASRAGTYAAIVAVIIVGAIVAYNMGAKRIPIFGPLNMGVCRGLSLLLGAAAVGAASFQSPPVVVAAVGLAIYVAAVTQIASLETLRGEFGQDRWRPLTALATCYALMFYLAATQAQLFLDDSTKIVFGVIVLGSLVWTWNCGRQLGGEPEPGVVSRVVGRLLQGLMLVQAALAVLTGETGLLVAFALVLVLPLALILGKRFYAS